MKFNKRLAAVAAAAVVGPTMLMSTPAMADEGAQPAVTVPDAEPNGDAADAPEPTPLLADAPEAEPAAQQPAAQAPEAQQPPAQRPAGPVAFGVAENTSDGEYEQPTQNMMGPEVTVDGMPKDGFKKDGSWTQLTVKVDNTGHRTVLNYTPSINIMQWDGGFTTSQVTVERLVGGVWKPVKALTAEAMGPGFKYNLGTTASVAAEAEYAVELRIAFAADTAVLPFELYSDGTSRNGSVVSASPGAWYQSKIEGAEDGGDPVPTVIEGPALTVSEAPASLTAGGGWANVTVRVDNAGKDAQKEFGVGLSLSHLDRPGMTRDQVSVEVYSKDENGVLGWHPTYERIGDEDTFGYELASGAIGAGKAFDVQLRIRVAADAPKGDFAIRAWGSGPYDEETHSYVESRSKSRLTKIVAADPNTGGEGNGNEGNEGGGNGNEGNEGSGNEGSGNGGSGNQGSGNTGNQPKPNGGATPVDTGTATTPATAPTGGELAATGADPATSWALGGAGVALAMGAALVAGTGRRRRTTA